MTLSYIALGANLGDAVATLQSAVAAIEALPGVRLVARAARYRTAPVGLAEQPDFINSVISVESDYRAEEMLSALFEIEQQFGRQRSVLNGPRTLDLDLLLHGEESHASARLMLPHPRMHERAFVLAPLADIAPNLVIPGHGSVCTLLARCADQAIERLP